MSCASGINEKSHRANIGRDHDFNNFCGLEPFVRMGWKMKELLIKIDGLIAIIPALLGGAIDYANQVYSGSKKWSVCGFAIHISSAVFFGWVCGSISAGLGYDSNVIASIGGIGGFLGVRVADLVTYRFLGSDRRHRSDDD